MVKHFSKTCIMQEWFNMHKGWDIISHSYGLSNTLMLANSPVKIYVFRSPIYFSCCTKSVQTNRSVMWWAIGSQLRWHLHGPSMDHSSHCLHPLMEIGSWLQNMDRMGVNVSTDLKFHHVSRYLSKRKCRDSWEQDQWDSKKISLDRCSPTRRTGELE